MRYDGYIECTPVYFRHRQTDSVNGDRAFLDDKFHNFFRSLNFVPHSVGITADIDNLTGTVYVT